MKSHVQPNSPPAVATNPGPKRRVRLPAGQWLGALLIAASSFNLPAAEETGHHHHRNQPTAPKPATGASSNLLSATPAHPAKFELPPLPPGISELKFNDFFVLPVGQRGLEATEKLRRLDGQRVRILGYMVHQEEPPAGRFLFTPMPAQIHEHDNGLADDLPASTLYVSVPTLRTVEVPYVPGLMLLTGTLSVGNQAEPDGRISVARLTLDPTEASAAPTAQPAGKTLSTPTESDRSKLSSASPRAENPAP